MPGDAAQSHLKVDARRNLFGRELFGDLDRKESNVIGVRKRTDCSSTIERNVELSRKTIKIAMVDQIPVKLFRQRQRFDDLFGVETTGRSASHIANIVGTRTLIHDPQRSQSG